jgi:histidyl-tRNA synthetase
MLLLLEAVGAQPPVNTPDAYAIVPAPQAMPVAMATCEALRGAGVSVQMHAGAGEGLGSMKSQFKKADASGARHALVFGADELARGEVTVKSLRDGSGAQVARPLAEAAAWAPTLQSHG